MHSTVVEQEVLILWHTMFGAAYSCVDGIGVFTLQLFKKLISGGGGSMFSVVLY